MSNSRHVSGKGAMIVRRSFVSGWSKVDCERAMRLIAGEGRRSAGQTGFANRTDHRQGSDGLGWRLESDLMHPARFQLDFQE